MPCWAVVVFVEISLSGLQTWTDLFSIPASQAQHFAPADASLLLDAVRAFMESRDIIGIVDLPVMLFFSSFAFRMLEDSIAIIFHRSDYPSSMSFMAP